MVVNAAYRPVHSPSEPAFDWISWNQIQLTMDRTLQESVGYYNPAMHIIVFVFLPSPSGNSVAIWRQKLAIPNNIRLAYQAQITQAMASLRKDYPVYVDEYVQEQGCELGLMILSSDYQSHPNLRLRLLPRRNESGTNCGCFHEFSAPVWSIMYRRVCIYSLCMTSEVVRVASFNVPICATSCLFHFRRLFGFAFLSNLTDAGSVENTYMHVQCTVLKYNNVDFH